MRVRAMVAMVSTVVLISAGVATGAAPAQATDDPCGGPRVRVDYGPGDDWIVGTDESEEIHAGAGNDTVYGLGGSDLVYGGPGNDSIVGGDCADDLRGNGQDDALSGGPGADVLDGGMGDDICSDDEWPDIVYFLNFTPC